MSTCTIHGYVVSRCGMCVEIEAKELKRERDEARVRQNELGRNYVILEQKYFNQRKAIEGAPHAEDCELANFSFTPLADKMYLCDCWKRKALEVKE